MNSSTSSFRSYVATLLALVTAASLIGLSATEWLVRSRVEPSDQFTVHLRMFRSAQQQNAGFGDSHMTCGFNPPPGMLNLAFPGESIDNMEYKARVYFANRSPSRVIVQADAHMFARYRMATTPGYNELFDPTPDEQSALSMRVLSSYHRPKLLAYWDVWLRKGSFESWMRLLPNGWTDCAAGWATWEPESRSTRARERAMVQEPAEDFSGSAFAAEYQSLIEDLVRKGARVCLVEFPVTPEYQREISHGSYQAARAWFDAQARRLGLRYLAHAEVYAQRPDLFSDMDHLNAQGAREFSRLILSECFE